MTGLDDVLPPNWDSTPCGLLATSPDGVILRVNATLCRWLGYHPDQLLRIRFAALLPAGARLFHQTHWQPMLHRQGCLNEVQLDLLHANGSRVPMLFNAARRHHHHTHIDEIAAFAISGRKKYEAELLAERRRAECAEAELRVRLRELEHLSSSKDALLAALANGPPPR